MSLAGPPSDDLAATMDMLALPEVRRQVHRMTVAEYQRLGAESAIEEKTELIRGVVIEKMSISPLHAWLVQLLVDWLKPRIGKGWCVRSELPVTLHDSEPEPDVSVVRGTLHDYRTAHPKTAALAIEIAVSSEKLDRLKAAIYAEAEIAEYWIVFAERGIVEVHRSPRDGQYNEMRILRPGESLEPLTFPGLAMPVAELFPESGKE